MFRKLVCVFLPLTQLHCVPENHNAPRQRDSAFSTLHPKGGGFIAHYHAEIPVELYRPAADKKRTLLIVLDQKNISSPERQQIFDRFSAGLSPEFQMVPLYVDNVAMTFVNSGRVPSGVSVREADPAASHLTCKRWSFLPPMWYDPASPSSKDSDLAEIFDKMHSFSRAGNREPLDSVTWPNCWQGLDSRLHISDMFEEHANVTPTSAPSTTRVQPSTPE